MRKNVISAKENFLKKIRLTPVLGHSIKTLNVLIHSILLQSDDILSVNISMSVISHWKQRHLLGGRINTLIL